MHQCTNALGVYRIKDNNYKDLEFFPELTAIELL